MYNILTLNNFFIFLPWETEVKGQEEISKWRGDRMLLILQKKDVFENGAILQLELVATRAYNGNMLPLRRSFN